MGKDIFGRDQASFGGAFDSSKAKMVIDTISDLIVSNVQVQYQQQLNRVYNIQDTDTYFVVGRTQGNGTLGTVIGPKNAVDAGIKKLGTVCDPTIIKFNFTGASCDGGGATFNRKLTDVNMNSVGFSIQANDMLVNENLGIQFGQLLSG